MPRLTMQEKHAAGRHAAWPRRRCPECRAESAADDEGELIARAPEVERDGNGVTWNTAGDNFAQEG